MVGAMTVGGGVNGGYGDGYAFFSLSPSSSDVGIEVDFKVRIHEI